MIRVYMLAAVFYLVTLQNAHASQFTTKDIKTLVEAGIKSFYPLAIEQDALPRLCSSSSIIRVLEVFAIGTHKSTVFDQPALECINNATEAKKAFAQRIKEMGDYDKAFQKVQIAEFARQIDVYTERIKQNCQNPTRDASKNLTVLERLSDDTFGTLIYYSLIEIFEPARERAQNLAQKNTISALDDAQIIVGRLLDKNYDSAEPLGDKLLDILSRFYPDTVGDGEFDSSLNIKLLSKEIIEKIKAREHQRAVLLHATLLVPMLRTNPNERHIEMALEDVRLINDLSLIARLYMGLVNAKFTPAYQDAYKFAQELAAQQYDEPATNLILSLIEADFSVSDNIVLALAQRNIVYPGMNSIPIKLYSALIERNQSFYYPYAKSFLESDQYSCFHWENDMDITAGKFSLDSLLVEHEYKDIFEHAKKALLKYIKTCDEKSDYDNDKILAMKRLLKALTSRHQLTEDEIQQIEHALNAVSAQPQVSQKELESAPELISSGTSSLQPPHRKIINWISDSYDSLMTNMLESVAGLVKECPYIASPEYCAEISNQNHNDFIGELAILPDRRVGGQNNNWLHLGSHASSSYKVNANFQELGF